METKFKVTKGTDSKNRIHGMFMVMRERHAGAAQWLYVWDENRGEFGSWKPVMPLDAVSVMHWEDLIKSMAQ